jgi:ElaB/YqjD/DUF883 family membrane-anchored ribosome-binding protein
MGQSRPFKRRIIMAIGTPQDLKKKAEAAGTYVGQVADDAKEKVQDAASKVAQKGQELASDVSHKAQDMASKAVEKTDDAIANVGHQMTTVAGKLREHAPEQGVVGSAAATVADNLQAGGRYLEQHGLKEMASDLTEVIKRHPVPAVLLGVGLGCMLGMSLSRR